MPCDDWHFTDDIGAFLARTEEFLYSRAALDAGARDVVLFTDPGNRTSNALYRRLGFVPVAEFTGYRPAGAG